VQSILHFQPTNSVVREKYIRRCLSSSRQQEWFKRSVGHNELKQPDVAIATNKLTHRSTTHVPALGNAFERPVTVHEVASYIPVPVTPTASMRGPRLYHTFGSPPVVIIDLAAFTKVKVGYDHQTLTKHSGEVVASQVIG